MSAEWSELIAQGFPLFAGALGENLTHAGSIATKFATPSDSVRAMSSPNSPNACSPGSTLNVYRPGIQQAIFDPQMKASALDYFRVTGK